MFLISILKHYIIILLSLVTVLAFRRKTEHSSSVKLWIRVYKTTNSVLPFVASFMAGVTTVEVSGRVTSSV